MTKAAFDKIAADWSGYAPGTRAIAGDGYFWTKWVNGSWRGCHEGNFDCPGNDIVEIISPRPSNMRPDAALALLGEEFVKLRLCQDNLLLQGFDDDEARFRAELKFSNIIEEAQEAVSLAKFQERKDAS